jgi:prepilin-type N-terminal cleavage/methylation domain-containing protein
MDLFPRSISDKHKKGFTITEVIVSALIIVVLSTGLFSAFWGTQHLLNRARHKAQAYNFAVEALDRLRSNYKYSDAGMNVANGYLASGIGGVITGEMAPLSPLPTDFTYDVTEPQVNGYKQVTIKVHWNEPTF